MDLLEALADYLAYEPFDPVVGPMVEALFYEILEQQQQL